MPNCPGKFENFGNLGFKRTLNCQTPTYFTLCNHSPCLVTAGCQEVGVQGGGLQGGQTLLHLPAAAGAEGAGGPGVPVQHQHCQPVRQQHSAQVASQAQQAEHHY